jgi:anti-sigma B factor antagonist
MDFKIARHGSGVQVISLRGRLTFGPHTDRCRDAVKAALAAGDQRFVFDLTGVDYADSAGLGFLVSCLVSIRQAGAELRLVSPPERVLHVLHITRLDTVFPIDTGQPQALAQFGS